MKNSILFLTLAVSALVYVGCSSDAHYIDPEGKDTIVSLNKVDIQDFQMAAESLIADMLGWDSFAGDKKPTVALSTVVNNTANNFDVALITNKVQQAILRSRRAKVSRAMSVDSDMDAVRQKAMDVEGATTTEVPTLSLTGKIIEVATNAGKTKQVSYVFQMQLAEVATGDLVWMGEKTITKQGKKNAVGW
ncbi:MAG: penicillin-binding protein activator LpoB [Opitutales bacterium]|nr:penicillin-binding protein activator LpoB [Opitutales bacterium]